MNFFMTVQALLGYHTRSTRIDYTQDFEEACRAVGRTPDLASFVEALKSLLKKRPTAEAFVDLGHDIYLYIGIFYISRVCIMSTFTHDSILHEINSN